MKKLLRAATILTTQSASCPFACHNAKQLQEDYLAYFRNAKEGDIQVWANGTLSMGKAGVANYTDPQGRNVTMTQYTNLHALYNQHPEIKLAFDISYGQDSKTICPFASQKPVYLKEHVTDQLWIKDEIRPTEWIESLCDSPYTRKVYYQIIELVAREIAANYSNRMDKRVSILDACLLQGNAPGHPGGAHSDRCNAIDFHYFTHGASNRTQKGAPLVPIWKDGAVGILFDWERNLALIDLFLECFPEIVIMVNTKILTGLRDRATPELRDRMLGKVQGDDHPDWNHHLHMHVFFSIVDPVINWDAIL